jgi:Protein kinase domain
VGRAAAIIGAIVLVLGGGAIGYAVTRTAAGGMSGAQSTAMSAAVAQLDGDIKAARSAVQARARTLSGLPVVRRAIITDARTVTDLVAGGELAFASNGELIELGRIVNDTKVVETLLLEPAGAKTQSHGGKPGSYLEVVGEQLVITEIAPVDPPDAAPFTGFLTVSRQLAFAPVVQRLAEAGIAGKLVIDDKEVPIGVMPAGATLREQTLSSHSGAKLVAAEPPAQAVMPLPILVGGVGAAVIGLFLLIAGMLGGRSAPGGVYQAMPGASQSIHAPPGGASTHSPGLAIAQTQLSQHGVPAAGTPSPHDPPGGPRIMPHNIGAGAMIGRWEVIHRLGSGGMADVFLARSKGDAGFEKLVAVKVMHSHLARNQRAVDHFLDEARLAARIHHPNVVAILDLGKIGEDYVIIMEYVEGVDLERLLTSARQGQRPVPIPIGLAILSRICNGLHAAHNATSPDGTPLGIIHRDVKSANVLVSRQGSVKVVDFGIAKAAKQVHFTVAGETKGTPSMMAPEQRVGEQVDVRADVYSVAAVGFELLTGHGVNLDLAALAHLGVENWPHLPLPSSLRAGLPHELDEILLHAMAFDRERRPPDCAALETLCEMVMRRHNLIASDKDIERWVESELRFLAPAFGGVITNLSKSSPA